MPVLSLSRQELVERYRNIDGLDVVFWDFSTPPPRDDLEYISLSWPITHTPWSMLEQLPRLRWVQVLSAGYEYAEPHLPPGVGLLNGRGIHTSATSELIMAIILTAQRSIDRFVLSQSRGRWERIGLTPGVADKKCLMVGYGDIGVGIAKRLVAMEASVTGLRRAAHPSDGIADEIRAMSDLPAIIGDYDIVIAVTPLNQETHHLFNADLIARMKPGALLVNAARGPVVDTDALLAALHAGRIRAALDVTEPEPLPDDHPLFAAPNCVIVPHVGGMSEVMYSRMARFLDQQLPRLAKGAELLNVIVPCTKALP